MYCMYIELINARVCLEQAWARDNSKPSIYNTILQAQYYVSLWLIGSTAAQNGSNDSTKFAAAVPMYLSYIQWYNHRQTLVHFKYK